MAAFLFLPTQGCFYLIHQLQRGPPIGPVLGHIGALTKSRNRVGNGVGSRFARPFRPGLGAAHYPAPGHGRILARSWTTDGGVGTSNMFVIFNIFPESNPPHRIRKYGMSICKSEPFYFHSFGILQGVVQCRPESRMYSARLLVLNRSAMARRVRRCSV